MDEQAWTRRAIIAAAAVVLAAAMPLTMRGQAYPFSHRTGAGYQVASGAGEGSTIDKANPTDDGSIIIECVGFDGRMRPHANHDDAASILHAVSMPQHSLGPSKCSQGEHKPDALGGGAAGSLMMVF